MSTTFNDNKKRKWNLVVDIPLARKVRDELGVDILNLNEGLPTISRDPILLCDVLYLLCQDQAEGRGVTDEDFGRSLAGDVFSEATDAFMEALINFFPPRQREMIRSMQATAIALQDTLAGMALEKMPAAVERLLVALGNSSPDSAESSESANSTAHSAS